MCGTAALKLNMLRAYVTYLTAQRQTLGVWDALSSGSSNCNILAYRKARLWNGQETSCALGCICTLAACPLTEPRGSLQGMGAGPRLAWPGRAPGSKARPPACWPC